MARHNKDWTHEEHILAFNLYCKIPFGSIHMHNPRIIELARLLGRTVGSVSLTSFNGARLLLPKKFAPDPGFLKRHGEKCLARQRQLN
jgi:hypothetical protein